MASRQVRMRWWRGALAAGAIAVLLAAAGCGSRGGAGGDTGKADATGTGQAVRAEEVRYPLQAKDDLGRDVTIAKVPERIVSLAPSNTEILYALGLGDRVVGVTDYCDYPPEAKAKEKVGGFKDPSVEKVVALGPDLVLATGGIQRQVVDQFEKVGVAVFVLDPHTVDGVLGSVRTVARLAGIPDEGKRVADGLDARVKAVRDRTAALSPDDRPAVFHEVWPDPLMTAGPGSFAHDMIELAGGRNVAAGAGQPYPPFSQEELVAADPAVIITPFAETAQALAQGKRPGWRTLKAVRDGRVVVVNQDLVARPAPRLVDGLEAFARAIHPELFAGGR